MSVAFILVRPQLAENVGTAARAMMNCALDDMRLVDPDEDHLCSRAIAASSGAQEILQKAKVFKTLSEAVADLQKVYATTGRTRDMIKPVFTGQGMANDILNNSRKNIRCGVLTTDFLTSDCVTAPVPDSPIILEVKWDAFLPEVIRDAVELPNHRVGAFSKYASCRIFDM